MSKLIKFQWEIFYKVDYIKVISTCLQHFRKCIPHNAFGNEPRGWGFHQSPHASHRSWHLSLQRKDSGWSLQMVLLQCSVGILITVRSLERNHAVNEVLNYSFQYPAKKMLGPHRPPYYHVFQDQFRMDFGRLYATGIILTTIPVGHYYLTLQHKNLTKYENQNLLPRECRFRLVSPYVPLFSATFPSRRDHRVSNLITQKCISEQRIKKALSKQC